MQNPYDQPPLPPPSGYGGPGYGGPGYGGNYEPVNGTLILILGILGVTACGFCAPVAWVMANSALKLIDTGRGDPSQRNNVNIGRILGIIGSVLIILAVIFYGVVFALALTSTVATRGR